MIPAWREVYSFGRWKAMRNRQRPPEARARGGTAAGGRGSPRLSPCKIPCKAMKNTERHPGEGRRPCDAAVVSLSSHRSGVTGTLSMTERADQNNDPSPRIREVIARGLVRASTYCTPPCCAGTGALSDRVAVADRGEPFPAGKPAARRFRDAPSKPSSTLTPGMTPNASCEIPNVLGA
jgi:hypothetical protein